MDMYEKKQRAAAASANTSASSKTTRSATSASTSKTDQKKKRGCDGGSASKPGTAVATSSKEDDQVTNKFGRGCGRDKDKTEKNLSQENNGTPIDFIQNDSSADNNNPEKPSGGFVEHVPGNNCNLNNDYDEEYDASFNLVTADSNNTNQDKQDYMVEATLVEEKEISGNNDNINNDNGGEEEKPPLVMAEPTSLINFKDKRAWILICVVICAVIGLSVGLTLSRNNNAEPDNSTTNVADTQPVAPPAPSEPPTDPPTKSPSESPSSLPTVAPSTFPSSAPTFYEWSALQVGIWDWVFVDQVESFGRDVALNGDGSILAIGAPGDYGSGGGTGFVRLYRPSTQSQIGSDIFGEIFNGNEGYSIELSNDSYEMGNAGMQCLVTGAPNARRVRLFELVNFEWEPVADWTDSAPEFGRSVTISGDCTVVAAGASDGSVRLFYRNAQDGSWIEEIDQDLSSDVNGPVSLSLSDDGFRLAIGSYLSDNEVGRVTVYEYNFREQSSSLTWEQIGARMRPPFNIQGQGGYSVSLSGDGNVVAFGAPYNLSLRGTVFIYRFNGIDWDIRGRVDGIADFGDLFGVAVSVSHDGSCVAARGYFTSPSGFDQGGRTVVYRYVSDSYQPFGQTIVGEGAVDSNCGEELPYEASVAISDDCSTLAIGNPSGFQDHGMVHVYHIQSV